MNNIKKNVNKGFSLVELIVVIAIMAVLTAVLAPSLLAYVERSRAQKDDSAMGEVTNAIMLALADQNVYDEVLCYTCSNNYSCYRDTKGADNTDEAPAATNKVELKNVRGGTLGTVETGDQWMYDDDERKADEFAFVADGEMRGVTITFLPHKNSNQSYFQLSEGKINYMGTFVADGETARELEYINGASAPASTNMTLETMASLSALNHHYLYNRVRATVGDRIDLTSQTYRNSTYTVFIRMGTTGGNWAESQDAILVYGQWNGTNLSL
jgi:type IV pilus assembly protein PilA